MTQRALDLPGGFHVGPLFVIRKQRTLVRPKGKEGVIHRAQTVRATPIWLSDEQRQHIRDVYAAARLLTEATGELHVVDHIVPKCGKTVCGLHVPRNLQVLHWKPNAQKGAFIWPDMWNEQMELL
jgi:hypothetical protein